MIYSTYLTHEIETPNIFVEVSGNRFERLKIIFQKFIDYIDRLYKNLKYNIFLKGSHYKKYKSFIDHGFEQIYTTKNIKCEIDSLDFGKIQEYLESTKSFIDSDAVESTMNLDNTIVLKSFNINDFIINYRPENANDLLSFTTAGVTLEFLNYFDELKRKCKRLISKLGSNDTLIWDDADNYGTIETNIRNMVQNTINVCTKCYKFTISKIKEANTICDKCIKVAKDELKKNGKWELTYDDSTTTESVNLGIFEGIKFI